jgi:hypothetical protein
MSERSRRQEILARIESGEISAEDGIAALMAAATEADASEGGSDPLDGVENVESEMDEGHESTAERNDEEFHDSGKEVHQPAHAAQVDERPKVGYKVVIDERVDDDAAASKHAGRVRINLAGFLGSKDGRSLRVRVGDENGSEDRVRIDLPVGIAEAGLRLLERLDPEGSWSEHRATLREEGSHTLLEVIESDGEHVRISVE